MKVNMAVLHNAIFILLVVLFHENLRAHFSAAGLNISDGNYRSKFAVRIEDHQLIVTALMKKSVLSELECVLECMKEEACLSFDVSRQGEPPGLWSCYLLSSDHYRHGDRLVARKGFDHFYFQNACSTFPCGAGEACIPDYESNSHSCLCKVHAHLADCQTSTKDVLSPGIPLWRVTTRKNSYNYSWTVEGGAASASVTLRSQTGSQFILHAPGLDPNAGNLSSELADHPNHYVIAENGYIFVKAYDDTQVFRNKATFYRNASSSYPGYEILMFKGSIVFCNPGADKKLKYKNQSSLMPNIGDVYWFKLVN